ncbi:hypothetical protein THAOC_31561 [Thalassiosira oceanica]|uniref:Uncharacterized protein n=1 Tax=Thalassiosira oceanica TaxID=159749 RepID=K0RKZ0_THAOC|nr:hypothetical protein THAOC_31561 [Thalassiosira oceanica]|eukprot:EJK49551.1 hypothetical protein THAOC_31561 [Thalassiosira oceanica]
MPGGRRRASVNCRAVDHDGGIGPRKRDRSLRGGCAPPELDEGGAVDASAGEAHGAPRTALSSDAAVLWAGERNSAVYRSVGIRSGRQQDPRRSGKASRSAFACFADAAHSWLPSLALRPLLSGGRRAYNLLKASFPVGYQAGSDDFFMLSVLVATGGRKLARNGLFSRAMWPVTRIVLVSVRRDRRSSSSSSPLSIDEYRDV